MVDFNTYNAPGVYVSDNANPLVAVSGVPPTVVCVIGAAQGYQTYTEILPISTVATTLTQRGIDSSTIVAVLAATPTTVLDTGDYTVVQVTTLGAGNSTTTIALGDSPSGSHAVTDGTLVKVSYRYTNAAYFMPNTFGDYNNLVDVYGQPLTSTVPADPTTSQVTSSLTLASKIAFENGANQIVALALDPAAGTFQQQFSDAYTKIYTNTNINIVVPVFIEPTQTNVSITLGGLSPLIADIVNHCVNATADGFPRIAIWGPSKNYNLINGVSAGIDQLATADPNARLMLAYPNSLNLFNPGTNQITTVSGAYLAAAYAGQFASQPINKALTREVIQSFAGIPDIVQRGQTKTFKDTLAKAGVCLAEINRSGQLVVRHGVSTDPTAINTREVSLTRQRDALFTLIQQGVESSGIVGDPITADMPLQVKGILAGILENAKSNAVLVSYDNLAVRQQKLPTGDPTVIEVKFSYLPAVPLNYVYVQFTLDLNTGQLDTDLTTAA